MGKIAITINGSDPTNIFPAFIQASSAVALGEDVIVFFTPYGAPALKKGELEKMKVEGMPDIVDLYESVIELDGQIMMCELATKVNDIAEDDFREGAQLVGMTTFLIEAKDSYLTFSY